MRLVQLRARKLLTIRELAKAAGVAEHTVTAVEQGRQRPSFRTIRKLCSVLEVQPEEVDEFRAAIERATQQV